MTQSPDDPHRPEAQPRDGVAGPAPSDEDETAISADGLGPVAPVHLLAAALHADREDISSLTAVLTDVVARSLPAGMVETTYHRRPLADRLRGRPRRPRHVVVHGGHRDLHLTRQGDDIVIAESRHIVNGVVISRHALTVTEWFQALAEDLASIAGRDARARQALAALLNPGDS